MSRVVTCVDGSIYASSVCDYAAWAAERLGAPVELVHALGRRETVSGPLNLSGNLELGGRDALLAELAELDAQKSKVATARARLILEAARELLRSKGVTDVSERLRRGDLADVLHEMEAETRLIIMGKRGEAADFAKGHLGSNVERVVRSVGKPLLVASRAFRPIARFLIAFDGGKSSPQIIERLVASPLLANVPCELFMVGENVGEAASRIQSAKQMLASAGYDVNVAVQSGHPDDVISERITQGKFDLLVMGAYGHSRIRNLVVGSTTSALIRSCTIPVLVIR